MSVNSFTIKYSLQLALKYKKYYKSLFLGFIDLASVNAFIVYNQRRVAEGEKKNSHIKFLKQLHLELVQMQEADWEIVCGTQQTPTKSRMGGPVPHRVHKLVHVDEWRDGNNGARAEAASTLLACKLPTSSKKLVAARVYLCNKIKYKVDGRQLSFYDIWHTSWRNGTNIPPSVKINRIRARALQEARQALVLAQTGVT
ncbi:hypothetical protein PPTG_22467 [Phytophthora nicotianae INRA-310]|uniref:PiggyBac transposable element-derived protein domain-containing protein n=2 Tax=Phytophthora nicotianae TaxID=4792 RepID=W2QGA6_PHYN3|nr:hypothetical protein PPTG_22467 [Phytophthora nicotianae INRA-310]ETN12207.1 hypothetical protein PPTG_22467 [Phytophthora nicotianae INRA-310]